jgi:hypothetical protein
MHCCLQHAGSRGEDVKPLFETLANYLVEDLKKSSQLLLANLVKRCFIYWQTKPTNPKLSLTFVCLKA